MSEWVKGLVNKGEDEIMSNSDWMNELKSWWIEPMNCNKWTVEPMICWTENKWLIEKCSNSWITKCPMFRLSWILF